MGFSEDFNNFLESKQIECDITPQILQEITQYIKLFGRSGNEERNKKIANVYKDQVVRIFKDNPQLLPYVDEIFTNVFDKYTKGIEVGKYKLEKVKGIVVRYRDKELSKKQEQFQSDELFDVSNFSEQDIIDLLDFASFDKDNAPLPASLADKLVEQRTKVEGVSFLKKALEENINIDGKQAIIWAIERGHVIDGVSALEWALRQDLRIGATSSFEWLMENQWAGDLDKNQQLIDPIEWALKNDIIIEGEPFIQFFVNLGFDPIDLITNANEENYLVRGEPIIKWALENNIDVTAGMLDIAVNRRTRINNLSIIHYVLENNIEIDGKPGLEWAIERDHIIDGKKPLLWALENDLPVGSKPAAQYAIEDKGYNAEKILSHVCKHGVKKISGQPVRAWAADHAYKISGVVEEMVEISSGKENKNSVAASGNSNVMLEALKTKQTNAQVDQEVANNVSKARAGTLGRR